MKPKNTPKSTRVIEEQPKSLGWKIKETLRLYSWVETLSKYIQIWGRTATIAFLLGGVIVASLAFFGLLPKFLISGKYGNVPLKIGVKPTQVRIINDKALPEWLQPYTFWLEQEAQAQVEQKTVKGFILCPLISEKLDASPEFNWMLKASPGFEVSGWGFSLGTDGRLYRLIVVHRDPSLTFTVPNLTDGDRLVAILVVLGRDFAPSGNCEDFISSIVS